MSLFKRAAEASASANTTGNIVPGHYIFRIDRVKSGISKKDDHEYVAIEATVVHDYGDGDPVLNDSFEPVPGAGHVAGAAVSQVMSAKHKSTPGNLKAFVANVGGIPEGEVGEAEFAAVCGDDQLFAGLFVEVRARTIKLSSTGKPFTVVGWVREVKPAEVADRVGHEAADAVLGASGTLQGLIDAYEE